MTHIKGGDAADSLTGGPGKDRIEGLGGDDTLSGGGGPNRLYGGDGSDLLVGGSGNDRLDGGAGDDRLVDAASGADRLDGGAGNDLLSVTRTDGLGHLRVELFGGGGDDRLKFAGPADGGESSGAVYLDGGTGDDVMHASGLDGFRYGGAILGDAGDDVIGVTDAVSPFVSGGAGDDRLTVARSSAARVDGGDGDDIITAYRPHYGGLSGEDGDDTIILKGRPVSSVLIDPGAGNAEHVTLDDVAMGRTTIDLGQSRHVQITIESTKAHLQPETLEVGYFSPGDNGDQLLLGAYLPHALHGWDGASDPFAAGYLRLLSAPHETFLQIDRDGAGPASGWTDLVRFDSAKTDHFTAFNFDGYDPHAIVV